GEASAHTSDPGAGGGPPVGRCGGAAEDTARGAAGRRAGRLAAFADDLPSAEGDPGTGTGDHGRRSGRSRGLGDCERGPRGGHEATRGPVSRVCHGMLSTSVMSIAGRDPRWAAVPVI